MSATSGKDYSPPQVTTPPVTNGANSWEMTLMIADIDIQHAAKELIERYGDSARSVAEDRITALSQANDQSAMDIALRVLSALESLLEGKRSAS